MPNSRKKEFLGKTLEEAFFFKMDQELIAELQRKLALDEKLAAFQRATGIRNQRHLMALVDAGFEVSTLTAFTWVPLVFVAWADGTLDPKEREAIQQTMVQKGVSPETTEMMIQHDWFRNQPDEELWDIWRQFIREALDRQPTSLRNELMDEIVTLCHVVANASGGVAGIGAISEKEWKVVDRVAECLCSQTAIVPTLN